MDPTETYGIAATMDFAGALSDISMLAGGVSSADFDMPSDPLVGIAKSLYMKLADGGAPLAFKVVSPADDGTIMSISFLPPGISYLNSFLGTKVVLGGILPTAMPPASPQEIFGFTGPDIAGGDLLTPSLELSIVPEPGSLVCVAFGVALMRVLGMLRSERGVD